jgi:hypothetical protein
MPVNRTNPLLLAAIVTGLFAAVLPLAACSVTVQEGTDADKKVDINTPVGDLAVRAGVDRPDTGLPIYPGATAIREEQEPESANVVIDTAWFGVKVVAAKYESSDAPETIADFYRLEMQELGMVTECSGEIDFKGRGNALRPACTDTGRFDGIQLVVGTEESHRIVVIKPRGSGSELALVYVRTRG